MFHISNLGKFGGMLITNTDRNGYVPELGDRFGDFDFSHISEEDQAYLKENWTDELNKVDELIQETNRDIQAWREVCP